MIANPRRWSATTLIAVLLVALVLPLFAGLVVVTYRDATVLHQPARAAAANVLRSFHFPFVFEGGGCGQPLAGNPNYGLFFADTLLLFVLPRDAAFGAHFALAILLGFWGARRWARAAGRTRDAATVAACAFVSCGVFLSAWLMFNSATALAIAPWVAAAGVKLRKRSLGGDAAGARRAAAELAVFWALEIVCGEPVTALVAAAALGVEWLAEGRGAADAPRGRKAARGLPRGLPAAASARGLLRGLPAAAAALALGAALAAPQIALAWQTTRSAWRTTVRDTGESVAGWSSPPVQLLDLATPFPFGRPDLRDGRGFAGHDYFGGREPLYWSLHLGLLPLALWGLSGAARRGGEAWWWRAIPVAVVLSWGAFLPGAALLRPLFSLGGNVRFPMKVWGLVALAVVPLTAAAAERWLAGARASRRRAALVAGAAALVGACGLLVAPIDSWRLGVTFGGVAAVGALAASALKEDRPRGARPLALGVLALGLAAHVPLFLTALDVPADRVAVPEDGGRVYGAAVPPSAHPTSSSARSDDQETVRDVYRRGAQEYWPTVGAGDGVRYVFNNDIDGSYSYASTLMRELVGKLRWSDLVKELRIAGGTRVVAHDRLGPPFRPLRRLPPDGDSTLYVLPGAAPEVRFATRVWGAPGFDTTLEIHRRPDYDPNTDVVLAGAPRVAEPQAAAASVAVESLDANRLAARVEAARRGVLVWSRAYNDAYRVFVDGRPASAYLVEAQLLGVPVEEGRHEVVVEWSPAPLRAGLAVGLLALAALAALRFGRRRGPSPRDADERPARVE